MLTFQQINKVCIKETAEIDVDNMLCKQMNWMGGHRDLQSVRNITFI